MKNISLSIKEHYLTDSYVPTFSKYDYVTYYDFENDSDIENLYSVINEFVHTCYEYTENLRSERSFKSASAILLDFDNKGSHTESTIQEFKNSDFGRKYNWFLYTSKSHITDVQDCYHVILPLDTNIDSVEELRCTYDAVFNELSDSGVKCDTQVRDGARLIFPSINQSGDVSKHFDNFIFDIYREGEYLRKSLDITEKTLHNVWETDNNQLTSTDNITPVDPQIKFDRVTSDDNDIIQVYSKMSKHSRYMYIRSIIKYMNGYNRSKDYTDISYNKWIAIGFSLYKLFGVVKGKKLFRMLSAGFPGDTLDSIDKQFSYLTECVYKSKDNLLVLLKMSSKMGFNHDMYMRYYYMNKHIYSSSKSEHMYNRMVRKLLETRGIFWASMDMVKIYNYSFKKYTRSFLLEIDNGGDITHLTVKLGEMMDIFADMLCVPRKYITTSITGGIIRRFINTNGVYDITRFIKSKILELVGGVDDEYIRVKHIHDIMSDIRDYAPSTIQSLLTNKNIELYMFELGVFVDKRKKRFTGGVDNKPYMAYKINKGKIILGTSVSVYEQPCIDYKQYSNDGIADINVECPEYVLKSLMVMNC